MGTVSDWAEEWFLVGEDSKKHQVPITFKLLGCGSFNAAYKATLDEDITLDGMLLKKGQSIVYKMVLLDPDSPLQEKQKALDTPDRSVRLWNMINPGLPAIVHHEKNFTNELLQPVGWLCPFIESTTKPTEKEIFDAVIDIFNRTGRVIADAHIPGNFLKTTDGKIICVDIGYAFDIKLNPDSENPISHASFNMAYNRTAFLAKGNSSVVNLTRALLYLQKHFPKETNADFLKENYDAILALAKVPAPNHNEIDIDMLKEKPVFTDSFQLIITTHPELAAAIKNNPAFSKDHIQLMEKLKDLNFSLTVATLTDIEFEIMNIFYKEIPIVIDDYKKIADKIKQLNRASQENFRNELDTANPVAQKVLLSAMLDPTSEIQIKDLPALALAIKRETEEVSAKKCIKDTLNNIRKEEEEKFKRMTEEALKDAQKKQEKKEIEEKIIEILNKYCTTKIEKEHLKNVIPKITPGIEKINRAKALQEKVKNSSTRQQLYDLLTEEIKWNNSFQKWKIGKGDYGDAIEACRRLCTSPAATIAPRIP